MKELRWLREELKSPAFFFFFFFYHAFIVSRYKKLRAALAMERTKPNSNLLPRGCPYIGVLPSTLALRDSYPRVMRLMTHSDS